MDDWHLGYIIKLKKSKQFNTGVGLVYRLVYGI
jgi:hypothetical protein